jgi:hypothetical protein
MNFGVVGYNQDLEDAFYFDNENCFEVCYPPLLTYSARPCHVCNSILTGFSFSKNQTGNNHGVRSRLYDFGIQFMQTLE